MTSPNPKNAPRWYGYFQATERTYGQGTPGGRVRVIPELTWFGVPSSRVLVLTHRTTPLDNLGNETGRMLHEWVVVVDDELALPLRWEGVGGFDPDGEMYPAYGVFVRHTYNHAVSGTVSRDYQPRQSSYAVTDLLSQPDSYNGPIGLFVQGVREVISHLDSASWSGPGQAILYDRESSFGWVTRADAPDFRPEQHGHWVPGAAGVYERFLLGTGTLDGWALYALSHVLVLEFWRAGVLLASRVLDCSSLAHLLPDPEARFVLGFGYDLERGVISLGAAGRGEESSGALCHIEYSVPELTGLAHENRQVYLGGTPVLYADGSEGYRTAWGGIKPVQGQFSSDTYLTQGKLTELMQEV